MGETVQLISARDGFAFDAWRAPVTDARRGGLVICHAIWGVTPHLRDLAGDYAEAGYETLVPSVVDRLHGGRRDQFVGLTQVQNGRDARRFIQIVRDLTAVE